MASPAVEDSWTEEKSLQLIEAYRTRPILWNQQHKSFYKKNLKQDTWDEVAALMSTTPEKCNSKMVSLLSSYRRERLKEKKSKGMGKDATFKSRWFAYDALKFLEDRNMPHKKKMMLNNMVAPIWTEEKCITLIRQYKARPVLWDSTHEFYYKKQLKLDLWKEIGQAVNAPPMACRRKMFVLMSSLRRERAKIRHTKDAVGKPYKSRWFAFKEMKFLMYKDTEYQDQIDSDNLQEDDVDSEQEHSSKSSQKYKSEVDFPEDALQNDTAQIEMVELNKISRRAKSDSEKEIKAFTDFIAMKMTKYSERVKNSVQQSICEIIFKADSSSYNEQSTSGMRDNIQVEFHNEADNVKLELDTDESDVC